MSVPCWLRRLEGEGRVLAPLPGKRAGYGVYSGRDRRRRPFAQAKPNEVQAALSAGALQALGPTFVLTPEGRASLRRDQSRTDQPFAEQHRDMAGRTVMEADGEHVSWAVKDTTPALTRYLKPQGDKPALLERVHASAAEILVRDYELSALTSHVTMNWSPTPGASQRGAPKDRSDAPSTRLDAQSRFLDALNAVGPGLDRLLMNILIRECGMAVSERELGWPARMGAPALKLALDRLAIHYRLKPHEAVI